MVRRRVERLWFQVSLTIGRALRGGRYSRVEVVERDGVQAVRKRRVKLAPLLVWVAGGLYRMLNTGVCILPQRSWEARERELHAALYQSVVVVEDDGTLVLPSLRGRILAQLLADPRVNGATRLRAVELAVLALAQLHARGFTHADAMAENVMIDLEYGTASWFDFENAHDPSRTPNWRRADDLRTLLSSCLLHAPERERPGLFRLILQCYPNIDVTRLLPNALKSHARALPLHLGQAPLSYNGFEELMKLLNPQSH